MYRCCRKASLTTIWLTSCHDFQKDHMGGEAWSIPALQHLMKQFQKVFTDFPAVSGVENLEKINVTEFKESSLISSPSGFKHVFIRQVHAAGRDVLKPIVDVIAKLSDGSPCRGVRICDATSQDLKAFEGPHDADFRQSVAWANETEDLALGQQLS